MFFILRSDICLCCILFLKFSTSETVISLSTKPLKYGIICAFIKVLYALIVLILIFLFLQFSKNISQAATTVISEFLLEIFLSIILNLSSVFIISTYSNLFPNGFMDGKTLRIPLKENGEVVEIKITLTAAKDVLGGTQSNDGYSFAEALSDMPTEEEIEEVKKYLSGMGMI